MNSKKPLWGTRAHSVRITKTGTITREDAEDKMIGGKPRLNSKVRQLIKKLLKKKYRQLDWIKIKGYDDDK